MDRSRTISTAPEGSAIVTMAAGATAFVLVVMVSVSVPSIASAPASTPAPAPESRAGATTIVVCAPGYPGSTEEAQPTMALFARALERAAGRPEGSIGAIYHESEEAGIARLEEQSSALALVTMPFFSRHARDRSLAPELQVVEESGETQTWTLVARKGSLKGPASLSGWEITGTAGYSAAFVSKAILGDWGAVPGDARITFTATPLSALRRAASGNNVAVVLDGPQSASLASLPFAAELETVTRSKPLPGTLLCSVGARLDKATKDALLRGLIALPKSEEGKEALKAMRMVRFEALSAGVRKVVQDLTVDSPRGAR